MKKLREFDCLSLTPPAASAVAKIRIGRVFPHAVHVIATDFEAQMAALSSMTGAYVLLLPAYVLPRHALSSIAPDPVLLNAGYRIGWMVKNAITSELSATPAPELWLRSDLLAHLETEREGEKPKIATLPDHQADWVFNTSSGAAFTAGFDHVFKLKNSALNEVEKTRKLVVAATFGSDASFSDWWHLGVLTALLGAPQSIAAYQKEKSINEREADMQSRLGDLARQARLELGLGIHILSRKNSVFFRQNRFLKPEREAFDAIAAQYEKLGKSGALKAQKYRDAASWVWGE